MPKEKIAIVSLLKPVDDVRSYHKMAKTLVETNDYEIHLIGYPSLAPLKTKDDIYFHQYAAFNPKGLRRALIPLKGLFKCFQLKPKLIIVNSPELLWVMTVSKILFGYKLLYDIQENHNFNIKYQASYPPIVRYTLATMIRLIEQLSSPLIDHFILAEKCYADELSFIKNRFSIIENKSTLTPSVKSNQHNQRILFSGTITVSNGAFRAIKLFRELHQLDNNLSFKIVGHCPQPEVLKALESHRELIELEVSDRPIPFSKISSEIEEAKWALVAYQVNPSNKNCLPTKVYDYAASGLPMIIEKDTRWNNWLTQNCSALAIEVESFDANEVLDKITEFEGRKIQSCTQATWQSERPKLMKLIKEISQES